MRKRKGLKAQMRDYNAIGREMKSAAEIATNGKRGEFTLYGRTYQTREFRSADSANDFMSRNRDWGVLAIAPEFSQDPRQVWVARKEDAGRPAD